jgi:DnaK suppressor protein
MPHASAERVAPRDRLADHLPALRARLEHQRQFRLEHLAELDAVVEDTAGPTNAADQARHEVTVKVAAAARQALLDIDAALALMTNGGYGRCGACHADLPIHLLQAVPTTRLCLNCRQRLTPADRPHPVHGRRCRASSEPSRRHHRHDPGDALHTVTRTHITAGNTTPRTDIRHGDLIAPSSSSTDPRHRRANAPSPNHFGTLLGGKRRRRGSAGRNSGLPGHRRGERELLTEQHVVQPQQ